MPRSTKREDKLLEQAAREIVELRPDAEPDDVLVWVASLRYHRGS